MAYGDSLKLRIEVSPGNATDKSVTWSFDKPSIATITNDGVVAIHNEGTVVFTVTTNDGGFTDSCTINIKKPTTVVPVSSVSLNKTTLTLDKGDSGTLTASVLPKDATNQAVTWSTSSDAVATVDSNGKITAVGKGEATITATSADNAAIKATCKVTVNVPVTGVSLDKDEETLSINETLQLKATVSPKDASNSNVTWKSSNELVATVSDSGLVTAKEKAGETTITVTTEDGAISATCKINVVVPVTGVTLDKTTLALKVGESGKFTATVKPADATNKNVDWTASDESVATVDGEGNVKAVGEGTAVITVETVDGKKTDTCTVTVIKVPVSSITLNKTEAELEEEDTLTLKATIAPEDASYNTVTWTSDNESVATVDENGKVTAISVGTATIKATADGKTAECTITVEKKVIAVERITLNMTEAKMIVGREDLELKATVYPGNATYPTVTWKSSDEKVAKVDSNGKVTAVAAGEATITAAADAMEAKCVITVGTESDGILMYSFTDGWNKHASVTGYVESGISAQEGRITIPSEYMGYNVTEIAADAFSECSSLIEITISEGVEIIESSAFSECEKLTKVVLPNTITFMNGSVFRNCSNLSSINIPTGVKDIPYEAFYGCTNLKGVSIPDNITLIRGGAFSCSGLETITIPGSVETISSLAFKDCSDLTTVVLEENIETIETNAFGGCTKLESITIPDSVINLYDSAFSGCTSLKSITLGSGITEISQNLFSECTSLSEIEIPDTVTTIGLGAFFNCTSLSTITIGSGVTSIKDNTFYKCPITSLTNRSTVTPKIEYIRAIYDKDVKIKKVLQSEEFTPVSVREHSWVQVLKLLSFLQILPA